MLCRRLPDELFMCPQVDVATCLELVQHDLIRRLFLGGRHVVPHLGNQTQDHRHLQQFCHHRMAGDEVGPGASLHELAQITALLPLIKTFQSGKDPLLGRKPLTIPFLRHRIGSAGDHDMTLLTLITFQKTENLVQQQRPLDRGFLGRDIVCHLI